jgi:hypothetical protein
MLNKVADEALQTELKSAAIGVDTALPPKSRLSSQEKFESQVEITEKGSATWRVH